MRSSIENLIKYLAEHHYDHVISMKIVKQPTAKDFNNFINFLFRCVDANYEPTGKLQDDVINMFKNIGYPFGISKTGLVAVGSPHTWPALLASMTWLIELLSVSAPYAATPCINFTALQNIACLPFTYFFIYCKHEPPV
jgi:kinetochore protein NDC80